MITTTIAIFLGPVFAVMITLWYQSKKEKQQHKFLLFRTLMSRRKEGTDKYRLPTDAEWEYVCRAATTTPFYTGSCISTDQANYHGNNPMPNCSKGKYREKTLEVASFSPNPWGLYDGYGLIGFRVARAN